MHTGDLHVDGVRLRYHRAGGNGQTVVLVHGMTDYSGYWTYTARALAETYDVVTYDMRGHGESDTPDGYTPDDYARDLIGLIATLGLNNPVVIGHSLGAATTAAAAAKIASQLRAAVMIDPPWRAIESPSFDTAPAVVYAEAWKTQIAAVQELDHAGRLAQSKSEHPAWAEEDHIAWAESKRLVRLAIFDGFIPLMVQPWRELVAQISCPSLLVTGDPTLGGIVTTEVSEIFRQIAPNGEVLQIADAGHSIHRDQPQALVAGLRQFLEHLA
ncbi:MAG: alpha/beta hydrolase [Roseiflexaceae bacterium]